MQGILQQSSTNLPIPSTISRSKFAPTIWTGGEIRTRHHTFLRQETKSNSASWMKARVCDPAALDAFRRGHYHGLVELQTALS